MSSNRQFRLTEEIQPERELQENIARILDALLMPPAVWFSAAIGAAKLSPQQAAALSRAGVKRGLPDIFVLSPGDGPQPNGRLYGIELKRMRGGQLSKTKIVRTTRGAPRVLIGQVERFAELAAAGMAPIGICHSVDEVLDQLAAWGVPLRGRVS